MCANDLTAGFVAIFSPSLPSAISPRFATVAKPRTVASANFPAGVPLSVGSRHVAVVSVRPGALSTRIVLVRRVAAALLTAAKRGRGERTGDESASSNSDAPWVCASVVYATEMHITRRGTYQTA